METSAFDEVLGLEEEFYDCGYQQGFTDGVSAGRIEGRTFGLEKGFEKYVGSGRLYGKSIVWGNRLPRPSKGSVGDIPSHPAPEQSYNSTTQTHQPTLPSHLPSLPEHYRLAKHIKVIHALSESDSLSTENTEDAVSDFDDRLKRAQGKAKMIERMAGEAKVELETRGKVHDYSEDVKA